MLKGQDCVILVKLLVNPSIDYSQRMLAEVLCISLAEINAGIKRLENAGLLRKAKDNKLLPNIDAAEEFLISGVKFFFPGKLGAYTRGIPTAIAAPLFQNKIALGDDPIPVWPDGDGSARGMALEPLYPSVPQALHKNPDNNLYEMLNLIDTIRLGRARERNMAATLLKEKLRHARQ